MNFLKDFHNEIKVLIAVSIIAIVVSVGLIFVLKSLPSPTKVESIEQPMNIQVQQATKEPMEIDISFWQTYRNEEFGFEVKYPEEWVADLWNGPFFSSLYISDPVIEQKLQEIQGEFSLSGGLYIRIIRTAKSLEEFIQEEYKHPFEINKDGVTENNIIVFPNGMSARRIKYLTPHGKLVGTLLRNEEKDITFEFSKSLLAVSTLEELGYAKGITDQILSTFRFIEPINTSDWQTYRNEEFGFEVKYPNGWFLAAPTRDFSSESCRENPVNEEITIFSRIKLEYCSFEVHTIPPQDADVTVWVLKDPWEDTASLLEPPIENLTMDGEPAVMYRYSYQQAKPNINAARIYFNHRERGYIVFLKNQDPQGYYYDPLYNQILSTFRFID